MKKFVALFVCAMIVAGAFAVVDVEASETTPAKPLANDVLNVNTGIHYGTIQAAITAAATLNEHTLLVYPGTYPENVLINGKKLNIIGTDRDACIIDAGQAAPAIRIWTNWCNISKLTCTNGSNISGNNGISIGAPYCRVNDTLVTNCAIGIYSYSQYSNISRNTIIGCAGEGIQAWPPSHHAKIANNHVTNNAGIGIQVNVHNSTISDNLVMNNAASGLTISYAPDVVADGNVIMDNDQYGIRVLGLASQRVILKNNIVNGTRHNIGIYLYASVSNVTIAHNKVFGNTINCTASTSLGTWNETYPTGGNYWGDYSGVDVMSGPNQNVPGSDGIGDTPYNITIGASTPVQQDNYPLMSIRLNHTPIRINSDADFHTEPAVTGGDGSEANPWRIEGWDVNASGKGCGIYVGNTTDHFLIDNCYVHHATLDPSIYHHQSGIFLHDAVNGMVYGNNVSYNDGSGILLQNTASMDGYNQILFNNIYKNNIGAPGVWGGIYLENADWNSVQGNNLTRNQQYGIRIAPGNNNSLEGNDISWTTGAAGGIDLVNSRCNNIIGNAISHSAASAIYLASAHLTVMRDNVLTDNIGGGGVAAIHSQTSDRCTYDGNTITGTSSDGITLDSSNFNTLSGNNIIGNSGIGLLLFPMVWTTDDNVVVGNNFTGNTAQAIRAYPGALRNRIYLNTFYNNNGSSKQCMDAGTNFWNATYPTGGNYWDDYAGTDTLHGAYVQSIGGADGVGDARFLINSNRWDYYPLMKAPVDGKVIRPPFRINANADFVGWGFPGAGTPANPWRINGYEINGTGYGYCIYVGNTTEYFTISNCTTYNATGFEASPFFLGAAIHIRNVIHGTVRGSNASGNDYAGIYLYGSSYCDITKNDAWREKNTSSERGSGVWITGGSMGCNVSFNNVGWSRGAGVRVTDSQTCNVSYNNVSYNNQATLGQAGIFIESYSWQSNNHTVWDNDITHNPQYGVFINGDNDSKVQNNRILFNCGGICGIYGQYTQRLSILDNNISYGTGDGLYLSQFLNGTISRNMIGHNANRGMTLWNCNMNTINDNNISNNNGEGYWSSNSNNNYIHNNSFRDNTQEGVRLDSGCMGDRIFHNDFIGNSIVPQAYDLSGASFWNATYPVGGNFWSDYTGTDTMHGPYPQSLAGPDGMGETVEPTSGAGTPDYYPLMQSIHALDLIPPNSHVDNIAVYCQNTAPMTVTATASDLDGVANVTLWYRYTTDKITWIPWTKVSIDTAAPWSWSFGFPNSNGYYEFFSIANDTAGNQEAWKGAFEAECLFDTVAPSSSVNTISPYWRNAATLNIGATATEFWYSGFLNVTLWFRFAADNATWGTWTFFGSDDLAPWQWAFNFPAGDGYYQFYSVATDLANNEEAIPVTADAICGHDASAPTSAVIVAGAYWRTTTPIALTATASDALSGVSYVELWFRYAVDNVTWGSWTFAQADPSLPWAYSFNFYLGDGYYEFQSRGVDNANNLEPLAGAADVGYAYDSTAPSSSVTYTAPYWRTATPITVDAAAADTLNGVASVELFVRTSMDNATWGSWTSFGADGTAPWSWSYDFGADIYYEFYTRATDTLGNIEDAPASADATWAYDITAPSSSATSEGAYVKLLSNWQINGTASDDSLAVSAVQLWYRYSADNITWGGWTMLAFDTAAPWQWDFNSPDGAGYYEFYTIAIDGAGNTEAAPATADAGWRYLGDITPPASSVDAIAGYWLASSPCTLTAAATDAQSGVANVTLWFRSSTDNLTWTAWTAFGTDSAAPWSWSFSFPAGPAYYQFQTTSYDNASNEEAAPGQADAICAYDAVVPTIQDTSALTATTGDIFIVTATVADNMALDRVYLIYWFGAGSVVNVSIGGNPRTHPITIPFTSLSVLHYRIAGVDLAGNWNVTAERNVPVSDNDSPLANAGTDQAVSAGTLVTLNGTASLDNIGITNYTWTFAHNGTNITLWGSRPTFTFWTNENYTVALAVRDSARNSDTDEVNIVVLFQTLTPPTANPGSDASVDTGQIHTFDGSGSTDDNGIVNYTWTFTHNGTSVALYGVGPQFTFWAAGTYDITLTVRDADGLTDTDTVQITVNEPGDNQGGLSDYYWVILIFIVILAVLLLLALLMGRKKKAEDAAPEEDDDEEEGGDSASDTNGDTLT